MTGLVSVETPLGFVKRGGYRVGQSIAELYREQGLSPSVPVVCLHNGKPLLRKRMRTVMRGGKRICIVHDYRRWEFVRARANDEIVFVCALQRDGDGGKNILRTVALIGLAIGAAVIAPALTPGILSGAIGGIAATALIQAGIVVGGAFLLSVLLPVTPATSDAATASGQQVSPTYSIDAQGNQARLFQPIPRLYGRHKIFPDFVAQPYTMFIGHEQFLFQTFGLGLGSYDVEKVSIGDISIWEAGFPTDHFPALQLRLFDPGAAPDLFPFNVNVSAEVSGQELRSFSIGNITLSGANLSITPDEPTGYNLTGFRAGDSVYLTNCGANDGNYIVANVLGSGFMSMTTNFPSAGTFASGTVNLAGVIGYYVATRPGHKATRIDVDITFPNGLGVFDNDGNVLSNSVRVYLLAQEIDVNTGAPLAPEFLLESPYTQFTDATRQPRRYTKSFAISPAKRLQVRALRGDDNTTLEKVLSAMFWTSLRGFFDGPTTFPGTTTMQVQLRAGAEIGTASTRTFNTIQTAKLPIWSGPDSRFWTAPQPTQSIAWALADVLRNEDYGLGRDDNSIDLDQLWSLSLTWDGRPDLFNGIYDTSITAWEALKQIAAAGRAQPVLVGNIVSFVRDQPAGLARGIFTPRNMRAGSLEITHVLVDDKTPTSVTVEYIDQETWGNKEIQCTAGGLVPTDNPARISLFGVTAAAQAQREGDFLAAANLYRRVLVSFSTELEGKLLVRGDTILVSHDLVRWGQSGEIAAPRDNLLLTVDNAPVWTPGQDHYIVFNAKNNRQYGPIFVHSVANEPYLINMDGDSLAAAEAASGPLDEILFNQQNDQTPTRYQFGVGTTYAKRCKVLSLNPTDMNTMQIVAVVDDDRVYVN